ncbi:hypothetical protein SDC9_109246 [bioreactor metagenome]|uniref:DUF155 domain-containing protein n=1 Tax=bioreactor metagenome TaxID=1076179 RepID=A0A645BA96_9ZZZZ
MDLTQIATHFGINRKYKWEEALRLRGEQLQGIVTAPEGKMVYIFHFGSAVFINFAHHEIVDFINYLTKVDANLKADNSFRYTDDYQLEVNLNEPSALNNDFMVTDKHDDYQFEIVATVLAKSVSLEMIEFEVGRLLDEIEIVVNHLYYGRLGVSDEKLAKMSASFLTFKLDTISYIMLLDKPDITWVNEEASLLYDELSTLFELDDRFEKVEQKMETLKDITEVFSGLAHAKRGNRLEWAVIILIAIEIVISLVEMAIKHL